MSVFAFASDSIDVYALGDAMDARGWHLDRQQYPPSLHLMVTPAHTNIVDQFISDLKGAAADVLAGRFTSNEGTAAMYGMLATVPDKTLINDFLLDLLDQLTTLQE